MIVRQHPAGRSFLWLSTYLDHDTGKGQTSERVSFVHTLNLAHDDVKSAVDSMLHTYRARHLLKAEAGIRPGGRDVEKPVKHVSLSWHASERPTPAQMIDGAKSYLKALGADEHEVVIWAHTDKKHPHVHLMINLIHPERGTALDTRFERRRAQEWAAGYEQQTGKVFCAERLKPAAERQASPPRNVWQELRRLEPAPAPDGERPAEIDYNVPAHLWRRQEWTVLKERQKDERVSFFEDLVGVYRVYRMQLYNTTGVSFRREWAGYYKMQRSGISADALKAVKDDLVARQKERYQQAVREAAPALREEQDRVYQALLASQKAERARLTDRQEVGRSSPDLLRRGLPKTIAPATFAPPANHRAPPQRNPGRPFVWAMKAGMVAQQRSADRWLDQALDRIGREAKVAAAQPPTRSRLAEARDRIRSGEKTRQRDGVAAGIEPDGPGGSGM